MMQPPIPPPPPPPSRVPALDAGATRLEAAAEALEAAAARQGGDAGLAREATRLREAATRLREGTDGAADGGSVTGAAAGNVSVVKNAQGHVVVTAPDGRTVTYDPSVGLDEDAIENMVQTALEPPRIPVDPNMGPNPERIVAIVFAFLFLMSLLIAATRIFGRRAAASAAPPQAVPPDLAARLARIEHAMEAVAIEVERISESERYSARLLTERLPERLPVAPAAPGQSVPAPTLDALR
jgi:hypothetical protein